MTAKKAMNQKQEPKQKNKASLCIYLRGKSYELTPSEIAYLKAMFYEPVSIKRL